MFCIYIVYLYSNILFIFVYVHMRYIDTEIIYSLFYVIT
jgi:hypothetical protein